MQTTAYDELIYQLIDFHNRFSQGTPEDLADAIIRAVKESIANDEEAAAEHWDSGGLDY